MERSKKVRVKVQRRNGRQAPPPVRPIRPLNIPPIIDQLDEGLTSAMSLLRIGFLNSDPRNVDENLETLFTEALRARFSSDPRGLPLIGYRCFWQAFFATVFSHVPKGRALGVVSWPLSILARALNEEALNLPADKALFVEEAMKLLVTAVTERFMPSWILPERSAFSQGLLYSENIPAYLVPLTINRADEKTQRPELSMDPPLKVFQVKQSQFGELSSSPDIISNLVVAFTLMNGCCADGKELAELLVTPPSPEVLMSLDRTVLTKVLWLKNPGRFIGNDGRLINMTPYSMLALFCWCIDLRLRLPKNLWQLFAQYEVLRVRQMNRKKASKKVLPSPSPLSTSSKPSTSRAKKSASSNNPASSEFVSPPLNASEYRYLEAIFLSLCELERIVHELQITNPNRLVRTQAVRDHPQEAAAWHYYTSWLIDDLQEANKAAMWGFFSVLDGAQQLPITPQVALFRFYQAFLATIQAQRDRLQIIDKPRSKDPYTLISPPFKSPKWLTVPPTSSSNSSVPSSSESSNLPVSPYPFPGLFLIGRDTNDYEGFMLQPRLHQQEYTSDSSYKLTGKLFAYLIEVKLCTRFPFDHSCTLIGCTGGPPSKATWSDKDQMPLLQKWLTAALFEPNSGVFSFLGDSFDSKHVRQPDKRKITVEMRKSLERWVEAVGDKMIESQGVIMTITFALCFRYAKPLSELTAEELESCCYFMINGTSFERKKKGKKGKDSSQGPSSSKPCQGPSSSKPSQGPSSSEPSQRPSGSEPVKKSSAPKPLYITVGPGYNVPVTVARNRRAWQFAKEMREHINKELIGNASVDRFFPVSISKAHAAAESDAKREEENKTITVMNQMDSEGVNIARETFDMETEAEKEKHEKAANLYLEELFQSAGDDVRERPERLESNSRSNQTEQSLRELHAPIILRLSVPKQFRLQQNVHQLEKQLRLQQQQQPHHAQAQEQSSNLRNIVPPQSREGRSGGRSGGRAKPLKRPKPPNQPQTRPLPPKRFRKRSPSEAMMMTGQGHQPQQGLSQLQQGPSQPRQGPLQPQQGFPYLERELMQQQLQQQQQQLEMERMKRLAELDLSEPSSCSQSSHSGRSSPANASPLARKRSSPSTEYDVNEDEDEDVEVAEKTPSPGQPTELPQPEPESQPQIFEPSQQQQQQQLLGMPILPSTSSFSLTVQVVQASTRASTSVLGATSTPNQATDIAEIQNPSLGSDLTSIVAETPDPVLSSASVSKVVKIRAPSLALSLTSGAVKILGRAPAPAQLKQENRHSLDFLKKNGLIIRKGDIFVNPATNGFRYRIHQLLGKTTKGEEGRNVSPSDLQDLCFAQVVRCSTEDKQNKRLKLNEKPEEAESGDAQQVVLVAMVSQKGSTSETRDLFYQLHGVQKRENLDWAKLRMVLQGSKGENNLIKFITSFYSENMPIYCQIFESMEMNLIEFLELDIQNETVKRTTSILRNGTYTYSLKEETLGQIIFHLLTAVSYLEKKGFVHGNIRHQAVLINVDQSNFGSITVKLGDFNSTRPLQSPAYYIEASKGNLDEVENRLSDKAIVGPKEKKAHVPTHLNASPPSGGGDKEMKVYSAKAPANRSPEELLGHPSGVSTLPSGDIWSIGLLGAGLSMLSFNVVGGEAPEAIQAEFRKQLNSGLLNMASDKLEKKVCEELDVMVRICTTTGAFPPTYLLYCAPKTEIFFNRKPEKTEIKEEMVISMYSFKMKLAKYNKQGDIEGEKRLDFKVNCEQHKYIKRLQDYLQSVGKDRGSQSASSLMPFNEVDSLEKLLFSCLILDPVKRITVQQALDHPVLKKISEKVRSSQQRQQ